MARVSILIDQAGRETDFQEGDTLVWNQRQECFTFQRGLSEPLYLKSEGQGRDDKHVMHGCGNPTDAVEMMLFGRKLEYLHLPDKERGFDRYVLVARGKG